MFTYDLMDGLKRVDYPDGNYVEYSYDKACRLTSVTTPFGSISYEYDLLDRLTRVVDRNGYATVYEYDANGNRTAVHYANGFTTTYDYDLLNRLIKQETVDIDEKQNFCAYLRKPMCELALPTGFQGMHREIKNFGGKNI